MFNIPNTNFVSFHPSKQDKNDLTTADLNKETVSQVTQCTKVGDNGEVITVSITTEESHQAQVIGKYEQPTQLKTPCSDQALREPETLTTNETRVKPSSLFSHKHVHPRP
jgi:hypothetical protein